MTHILHVVGARPNFMKIAPIMRAMAQEPNEFEQLLVHTGQHYDTNMSQLFFDELDLPRPDVNLEVGSGSHAWQTAQVMLRFEPVLFEYRPDWVIVPGDVNSTLACALVASKLGVKVAHVEAGLRSFDRTMPEEINRLVTDQIADLLLTPSPDGTENLLREGVAPEKIRFVGNVMIDTLVQLLPKAEQRWPRLRERLALRRFLLVTLHRPSNVDEPNTLRQIILALDDLAREMQIIFPVHPRTRQRITTNNLQPASNNLHLLDPLGYLDFLALQAHASLVLTDSGGVQEETTYLGVPCLTARPNTERPVTVTAGTNRLVASTREALVTAAQTALQPRYPRPAAGPPRPERWDGHTAERIVALLRDVPARDRPPEK
ncbi:MAG: UDP-N-acetylglucosamine 2-epimerase (non-hydrolyzing) [Ardenticatenaceae bacterium]|nr:UDP-N-acetylglucosamine 2-epimerase (non-hydrolyzing) [Ardenticatenaceae bacterium]